jgi:hypothetical protein
MYDYKEELSSKSDEEQAEYLKSLEFPFLTYKNGDRFTLVLKEFNIEAQGSSFKEAYQNLMDEKQKVIRRGGGALNLESS